MSKIFDFFLRVVRDAIEACFIYFSSDVFSVLLSIFLSPFLSF